MKLKTKNNYLVGCHCGVYHSGNNRLAISSPGWAQCQGCGHLYDTQKIGWDLAHPDQRHAHLVVVEESETEV